MNPTDPIREFRAECERHVAAYAEDRAWQQLSRQWLQRAFEQKYMYNFTWLGRPIIQTPIDMVAMQELIWSVRPDLVVETGIAHGGSLILSASLLALLDYCDAASAGTVLDPKRSRRRVLGVDIDIRAHNRAAIEAHPMAHRIDMIQGSSIDPGVVARVRAAAARHEKVLVLLDSNHTHEHVLAELEAYAPLTTRGSYCVVFDTIVADMPEGVFPDRPWNRADNPKTAVREYLRRLEDEGRDAADGSRLAFEVDEAFERKLMITVAPAGYLKRVV
jgi:cephalosporin hydroxylase